MKPHRPQRAFTLIELLIVVAIIAILAAIAVPNFLEAQTRAKVSRAKSDMRSLATAIEAYAVDYNMHPIAEQWVSRAPNRPVPDTFNNRLRGLTTPVAFITTLPLEIFWDGNYISPISIGQHPTFEYEDLSTAVNSLSHYNAGYSLFSSQEAYEAYYLGGPVVWAMHSPGPDLINDFKLLSNPVDVATAEVEGILRIYDPTNGTASGGDVVRNSKEQRN